MENLHLKNLDLEKAFKKSKIKKLPEQIKVNMQTPTVIDVDKDDEDDKDVLFESFVTLLMIVWLAVGLVFAFTHPYLIINIGESLYNLLELLLGL